MLCQFTIREHKGSYGLSASGNEHFNLLTVPIFTSADSQPPLVYFFLAERHARTTTLFTQRFVHHFPDHVIMTEYGLNASVIEREMIWANTVIMRRVEANKRKLFTKDGIGVLAILLVGEMLGKRRFRINITIDLRKL